MYVENLHKPNKWLQLQKIVNSGMVDIIPRSDVKPDNIISGSLVRKRRDHFFQLKIVNKESANISKYHYYQEVIEKIDQFRIHVINNKVSFVSRLVPKEYSSTYNFQWKMSGFRFIIVKSGSDRMPPKSVLDSAEKISEILDHKISAQDWIVSKDGRFLFIESNKAPGLCDSNLKRYKEAMNGEDPWWNYGVVSKLQEVEE